VQCIILFFLPSLSAVNYSFQAKTKPDQSSWLYVLQTHKRRSRHTRASWEGEVEMAHCINAMTSFPSSSRRSSFRCFLPSCLHCHSPTPSFGQCKRVDTWGMFVEPVVVPPCGKRRTCRIINRRWWGDMFKGNSQSAIVAR
jgi:hypothetical protein